MYLFNKNLRPRKIPDRKQSWKHLLAILPLPLEVLDSWWKTVGVAGEELCCEGLYQYKFCKAPFLVYFQMPHIVTEYHNFYVFFFFFLSKILISGSHFTTQRHTEGKFLTTDVRSLRVLLVGYHCGLNYIALNGLCWSSNPPVWLYLEIGL